MAHEEAQGRDARGIVLEVTTGDAASELVARLAEEDFLGQLVNREGRVRELALERDTPQLDWVDGIEKALDRRDLLALVEEEAAASLRRGYNHLVWSGMGGSVQAVQSLVSLGLIGGGSAPIHTLDSTDPAAINRLLRELVGKEEGSAGPSRHSETTPSDDQLREAIGGTIMVAVAMGMTSEEPITHVAWFWGLMERLGVEDPASHVEVIALEGSFLEDYARQRGIRSYPLALQGVCNTPGRMSAPSTRVFLRPVAWSLVSSALKTDPGRSFDGSLLAAVLGRAQHLYGVSRTSSREARTAALRSDPFINLAAFISSEVSRSSRNKLLLSLPPSWHGLALWIEQVVEESLGKKGKGFVIFYEQDMEGLTRRRRDCLVLRVEVEGQPQPPAPRSQEAPVLTLKVPIAEVDGAPPGMGEVAGLFAGFEKMVAAFGYLQGIVFAGQPAVEGYKRYARELRDGGNPLPPPSDPARSVEDGNVLLDYSAIAAGPPPEAISTTEDPAGSLAAILRLARKRDRLEYLDLTYNGEPPEGVKSALEWARTEIGNGLLGVPVKVRTGPQAYHSTEQSETDGPPELTSIRFVCLEHDRVMAGAYDHRFLLAQAYGTWMAMKDAGRWIVMVTLASAATVEADLRGLLIRTKALLETGE